MFISRKLKLQETVDAVTLNTFHSKLDSVLAPSPHGDRLLVKPIADLLGQHVRILTVFRFSLDIREIPRRGNCHRLIYQENTASLQLSIKYYINTGADQLECVHNCLLSKTLEQTFQSGVDLKHIVVEYGW